LIAAAKKMTGPPVLDGKTDEWGTVPVSVLPGVTQFRKKKSWRGTEDLSAQMKLGWDEEALYFLIEVKDDVYMQLAEPVRGNDGNMLAGWGYFYASDSVEMCFDRGRMGDRDPFAGADILLFALAAKAPGEEGAQWGSRGGGRMRLASELKEGGYVLEGAIPWEGNFPGVTAEVRLTIPFDVKFNDRDEPKPDGRKPWDTSHTQSLIWCSGTAAITRNASGYGAIVLLP